MLDWIPNLLTPAVLITVIIVIAIVAIVVCLLVYTLVKGSIVVVDRSLHSFDGTIGCGKCAVKKILKK